MPGRPRRYTLHTAAVMAVLKSQPDNVWSCTQIAEECELTYGSIYSVVQRMHREGLVARVFIDGGGVGHTRNWWELTERGEHKAITVLKYTPDPLGALTGLVIEETDGTE